jgi:hypothetical protein
LVDDTFDDLSESTGAILVHIHGKITNDDGLLRFSQLRPGTYQLKEVGANWCHAESDNVDAPGNLLVHAGQRTNVWISNGIKTNQPPNTGADSVPSEMRWGLLSSGFLGYAWARAPGNSEQQARADRQTSGCELADWPTLAH